MNVACSLADESQIQQVGGSCWQHTEHSVSVRLYQLHAFDDLIRCTILDFFSDIQYAEILQLIWPIIKISTDVYFFLSPTHRDHQVSSVVEFTYSHIMHTGAAQFGQKIELQYDSRLLGMVIFNSQVSFLIKKILKIVML